MIKILVTFSDTGRIELNERKKQASLVSFEVRTITGTEESTINLSEPLRYWAEI
jgi:hypothetical protein